MGLPIPEGMDRPGDNPYRTPFSWRTAASSGLYSLLSGLVPGGSVAGMVDRQMGYPVRSRTTDRWFRAQNDRDLAAYNDYMREMMREDDPSRTSLAQRIGSWFRGQRDRQPQQQNPYSLNRNGDQFGPPQMDDEFGPPRSLMNGPGQYNRIRMDPNNPYLAQNAYNRQALRQFGQRNRSSGGGQQGRNSTGYFGDIAYEWTRPTTVDDIRFSPRWIER